jgi:pimeloyl-ACP methyl ester carboxylesterase
MSKRPRSPDAGDEAASAPELGLRHVTYSSADGLALHAADYGDPISPWLPVICLPGLSRNARDFHDLAVHLSTHRHRPRRVVAFDYRGRGLSQSDRNLANYNTLTEMTDVLDGMAALGIPRAIVVGTSRGGIIAMLMGIARPTALAAVVLNDIGPVIEPLGLARIKSYIGRMPAPDDWHDAIALLKRLHGVQFTSLSPDDWLAFARMTWREEDGRPVGDYDRQLARTFDGIDFDRPLPVLWNEFGALKALPMMVIRGANSDLLSEATVAAMAAAHPGLETVTVEGEGHAPLLRHAVVQKISAFITSFEGSDPPMGSVTQEPKVAYDLDAPAAPAPAQADQVSAGRTSWGSPSSD